jgi:hypothetical protein
MVKGRLTVDGALGEKHKIRRLVMCDFISSSRVESGIPRLPTSNELCRPSVQPLMIQEEEGVRVGPQAAKPDCQYPKDAVHGDRNKRV